MKKMLQALGMLFLSAAVSIGSANAVYADESNGPQDRRETNRDTPQIPIDLLLLLLSMIR
jgi:hypothetical protein